MRQAISCSSPGRSQATTLAQNDLRPALENQDRAQPVLSAKDLVRELLDLARLQTIKVGVQLALHHRHQEVERDDVDHRHREDHRVGEVDHGAKLRRRPYDHEEA